MANVRTIFGDIDSKKLGFTYSHEHIFCSPPHWVEQKEEDFIIDDRTKTAQELLDFVQCGGKTIVDATVIDYGRDIETVSKLAKETGLQVVATTGFNKRILWNARVPENLRAIIGDYATFEDWLETSTVNELTDYLIREVELGIDNTDIKAGQLKFGTWYNSISPLEKKTIQAVALAHHHTKAPIHSHTEAGTMGLEQIEQLEYYGVNIQNVSLGHLDRNLDNYYHQEIAKKGAFLCFDSLGKIKYAPESSRIEAILTLCRQGYEDQILLSNDLARRSYYKNYGHGVGFEFIIKKWIPRFIQEANSAGMSGEKLVEKFFQINPQKCFSFKA